MNMEYILIYLHEECYVLEPGLIRWESVRMGKNSFNRGPWVIPWSLVPFYDMLLTAIKHISNCRFGIFKTQRTF